MGAKTVNLLLSSAGRRPYLVEWFRDALLVNGASGRVVVADSDDGAPSRPFGDHFVRAPGVTDPRYNSWLAATLRDEQIDLAISLNDFELSLWAKLEPDFPGAASLLRLTEEVQLVVEDKVMMAKTLTEKNVPVPMTLTAAEALSPAWRPSGVEYVTKGRYGSASRGLRLTNATELTSTVQDAMREVTDHAGRPSDGITGDSLQLLVVQDRVRGQEFGLDILCDLDGKYVTTFARRKVKMRAGETDRAESVDAEPFLELGRRIAEAIPHRGLIDVDVLLDVDGEPWVIDVNPRFGGGYPFSHLAGAHAPAAYVSWLLDVCPDPAWLVCEKGVLSSKYVGVVRTT